MFDDFQDFFLLHNSNIFMKSALFSHFPHGESGESDGESGESGWGKWGKWMGKVEKVDGYIYIKVLVFDPGW